MLKPIKDYIINFQGYKTNRKLIAFLVDDYGTIRIASSEALHELGKSNQNIINNRFNKFDAIASAEDLNLLFNVLKSVKDKKGNSAVFTPMTVVANPNFEAIEKNDFQKYYYETFYQTLDKRKDGKQIKALWKEGIEQEIFLPEFHGREHLNVRFWMNYLTKRDENILAAFKKQSIGIEPKKNDGKGYMAAFDFTETEHLLELDEIVQDGLNIFEQLFGYRSVFFTPSALIHNDAMHPQLKANGINFVDMARSRIEPQIGGGLRKRFHYMGQKNKFNQTYITRNVMFEPNKDNNAINKALKEIEVAFKYKKPAIISSHRVNFVSGKNIANRDVGLQNLQLLLNTIVKKWPDVEFIPIKDVLK